MPVANPAGVNGPRNARTTGRLRQKLTNIATKQNAFPQVLVVRDEVTGAPRIAGRPTPPPRPQVVKSEPGQTLPDVKATIEKMKALTQTQLPASRVQPASFATSNATASIAATLAGLAGGIGRTPTFQGGPSRGGSPRENMALGKAMAAQMGWTGREWKALKALWMRESGWRTNADNPTSSAYGIPQAMMSVHFGGTKSERAQRYMQSPRLQILWGLRYIQNRYGSPRAALAHSDKNHWY